MSRLPFDPDKMAQSAEQAKKPPARREQARYASVADAERITVSQLARLIDTALKDRLPSKLRVVGEISGFKDRTHWYFSLKDEDAVIGCVMFASARKQVSFRPEDGMEVVITGRVEHFARQGRTQLYAEAMTPVGAGALDLRFRELCETLREAGYFDEVRKRPLPLLPKRIAVITSRTGAALQDVLNTMKSRCAAVEILVADTRVQGEQAAPQIAETLRRISSRRQTLGVDLILLTRGGGSLEDLWAFNERAVADAIFASEVPVVAAIGHETDTTIAELVADVRASTPTQAAVRIAPDAAALSEQVDQYASRLGVALQRRVSGASDRLRAAQRSRIFTRPRVLIEFADARLAEQSRRLRAVIDARIRTADLAIERLGARLARERPEAVFAARAARLRELEGRLNRAVESRIASFRPEDARRRLDRAVGSALVRRRERLAAVQRALTIAGPSSVLNRGFSMTLRSDGRVVRSPADVRAGDVVETRLADGSFRSRVEDGRAEKPSRPAPAPPEPRKQTGRRRADDQPGLFGDE